jgi:hypothetical protein
MQDQFDRTLCDTHVGMHLHRSVRKGSESFSDFSVQSTKFAGVFNTGNTVLNCLMDCFASCLSAQSAYRLCDSDSF